MSLETAPRGAAPPAESAFKSPFVDPWEIVRRRWRIIAGGLLIGVWTGLVFYLAAPPVFESVAEVLVIQKDPNLPAQGTDRGASFASDQFANLLTTHLQLIVSPRVVRDAIEKARLDLLPALQRVRKADDPEGLHYVVDHLEPVLGDPENSETETSRVLHVNFRHSSPEECSQILQAVVESYRRFVKEKFGDVGNEAVRLLAQAQKDLGEELKEEELAYLGFLEHAPLMWRGDGGKSTNVYQQRILALEAALSDVRLRHTEARARLEVIERALSGQDGDRRLSASHQLALLNEKEVARLQLMLTATKGDANNEVFQSAQPHRTEAIRARYAQLLELQAGERSLLTELGERHPRVLVQREKIRATRDFLEQNAPGNDDLALRQIKPDEMVSAYLELLKNDVGDLENREQDLLERSSREAEAAKSLLVYELRGEAMHQEVLRRRELYEAVVDRLKSVNLINDFGGVTTEVIAPAEIGREPKLYLPLCLVLGAVLGTFAGGGLAWAADVRDRALRDPGDVRRHTGQLPILAHVLQFDRDENAPRPAQFAETGLFVQDAPESAPAKAIRRLCTALAGARRGTGPKVIEVVSSNDGDGKSTLAANIAAVMALSGSRVLAVDADLRSPSLHTLLGTPNDAGLSDVVSGRAASVDVIGRSRVPNLDVMCAGAAAPPTGGWASSPGFRSMLDELRNRYDVIVIDTPGVLCAADPCELASQADAVVLVVNPAATERTRALRTTLALRAAGAPLIGVVVNAVSRSGSYECDDLIDLVGQSVSRNGR